MTDFDIEKYKTWCDAYPEDIFTPLKGEPIQKTGDYDTPEKNNLITRASAAMGRHMIESAMQPLITELERLVAVTEADAKEIGSYREETGLRGEFRKAEKEVADLTVKVERLTEVAQEFCDRVDKGEARSTYTYDRFKEALGESRQGN